MKLGLGSISKREPKNTDHKEKLINLTMLKFKLSELEDTIKFCTS